MTLTIILAHERRPRKILKMAIILWIIIFMSTFSRYQINNINHFITVWRETEANIPSVLVLQQLSTDWRDFAVRLCYISHFLFVKFFLFWPLSFPFVLGIPHSSVFYCSFNNTPVPYPGNK